MVLDQEYTEDEQITVSAASKTKNAHLEMPFHRIQKWTGQYFRPGSLWKVGVCVIVNHGHTDWRCEWLKHKADEQIRLQATCDSQDEGEDEVEEVEDTYRDRRADADITVEQRDGGVEEHFDIDEIIEELEKEEARHAHGGEEDLDGANEEDEGKADKDVWLSPGSSMLPHREEYTEFLRAAENIKTKAPCENSFRAIENTLLYAKTCDINGIVAIACPRHGCFAPGGVADLYRGEQQKNVNWVLLQSLKYSNMDPEQGLLFFYDIACQYSVHFQKRIGHRLPVGLDTDFAIGQFHVHGHKENCLFRFLSMFIPQSGVVIGKILESLWANLNAVTPVMRTATLAH
ncbi:hypothetical protein BDN71DRAFT_1546693 [Pleurotus eryngii]|uniref:Uncharacterized protein n=1 Tax=Pleurotus eryngii TaxID=5323 RepID=A0A9P6DH61_PLEER|nr:hypothetical protein BDN71DRAFT_1546693 [Pleurotus eryngii]